MPNAPRIQSDSLLQAKSPRAQLLVLDRCGHRGGIEYGSVQDLTDWISWMGQTGSLTPTTGTDRTASNPRVR